MQTKNDKLIELNQEIARLKNEEQELRTQAKTLMQFKNPNNTLPVKKLAELMPIKNKIESLMEIKCNLLEQKCECLEDLLFEKNKIDSTDNRFFTQP